MPKNAAMLFLLLLTTMLLGTGCQALSSEDFPADQNQSPGNRKVTLAGIGLGDSSEHVIKLLGDDCTSEPLHEDGSWFGEPTTRWLYEDLELIIGEESNTVLQINLYGEGYSTSGGDRVGDRADKVLPNYEKKYALAKDHFEGKELPGWFVVEEGQWLIFNFKNDETMVNQSIADADPVESIHLVYEKFMH